MLQSMGSQLDTNQQLWTIAGFIFCFLLVAQWCQTLCDPLDCSPPGSSVHGILQARIMEWVAMPSSRGSSQPRVSCIAGRFLTEPPGNPPPYFFSIRIYLLISCIISWIFLNVFCLSYPLEETFCLLGRNFALSGPCSQYSAYNTVGIQYMFPF